MPTAAQRRILKEEQESFFATKSGVEFHKFVEGPTQEATSLFFDLGSPRMRTRWQIQSFQFQFSAKLYNFTKEGFGEVFPEVSCNIEVLLYAGNVLCGSTIIRTGKIPGGKLNKEFTYVEPGESELALKVYELEQFSAVTISRAESVAIEFRFSLEDQSSSEAAPKKYQKRVLAKLINLRLNLQVQQEFGR